MLGDPAHRPPAGRTRAGTLGRPSSWPWTCAPWPATRPGRAGPSQASLGAVGCAGEQRRDGAALISVTGRQLMRGTPGPPGPVQAAPATATAAPRGFNAGVRRDRRAATRQRPLPAPGRRAGADPRVHGVRPRRRPQRNPAALLRVRPAALQPERGFGEGCRRRPAGNALSGGEGRREARGRGDAGGGAGGLRRGAGVDAGGELPSVPSSART